MFGGGGTKRNAPRFVYFSSVIACLQLRLAYAAVPSPILSVLPPCPLALGAKSQAVMAEENGTPLLEQDSS